MNIILDIVRAILDIPISYSNVFGPRKMSETFLGMSGFFIEYYYLLFSMGK